MEDNINTMDTQPNTENGILGTMLSILSAVIAWISLQNFQTIMAICASFVAAVSGILAGYNWYLAIVEKRHNIRKHKQHKP